MVVAVRLLHVAPRRSTVGAMGLVLTLARTAETGKKDIVKKLLFPISYEVAPLSANRLPLDGVEWNVQLLVEIIIMIGT